MGGLLLSPSERQVRQQDKRLRALRFLHQPLYSTAEILGRAMGLNTSAGWYRTIHQMEEEGLIAAGKVELHGKEIGLWGITSHGQAMAHAWLSLPLSYRSFQPSKVGMGTLMHLLGLQKLQLGAEAAGWTEWTYSDLLEFHGNKAGRYRPDAIAKTSKGRRVAVEYERTLKSPKRYREILSAQVKAFATNELDSVVFVAHEPSALLCLERYIRDVKDIPDPDTKRTVPLNPAWLNKIHFRQGTTFPHPSGPAAAQYEKA